MPRNGAYIIGELREDAMIRVGVDKVASLLRRRALRTPMPELQQSHLRLIRRQPT